MCCRNLFCVLREINDFDLIWFDLICSNELRYVFALLHNVSTLWRKEMASYIFHFWSRWECGKNDNVRKISECFLRTLPFYKWSCTTPKNIFLSFIIYIVMKIDIRAHRHTHIQSPRWNMASRMETFFKPVKGLKNRTKYVFQLGCASFAKKNFRFKAKRSETRSVSHAHAKKNIFFRFFSLRIFRFWSKRN